MDFLPPQDDLHLEILEKKSGILKLGLLKIFGLISRTAGQQCSLFSQKMAKHMAIGMQVA
jgi:hypothetical protein